MPYAVLHFILLQTRIGGGWRGDTFMVNLSVKGEEMHANHSDLHPRDCLPANPSLTHTHTAVREQLSGADWSTGLVWEEGWYRWPAGFQLLRFTCQTLSVWGTQRNIFTLHNRAGQDDDDVEQYNSNWTAFLTSFNVWGLKFHIYVRTVNYYVI